MIRRLLVSYLTVTALAHSYDFFMYYFTLVITPMAMLWQPETPAAEKWAPTPDWRTLLRRWARPAIVHAGERDEESRFTLKGLT